jgi:hypothetical protein
MSGPVYYFESDGINRTPVTEATPMPVELGGSSAVAAAYTDRSIASATGASQTLIAANTARTGLIIANPIGGTNWTVSLVGGTVVADTPPGILLRPGDSMWLAKPPTNAITAIGTSTAKLTVLEA